MLGGAPVVLPIPEVYTALREGVIDGAASPVGGLLGVKWHEVAKYLAQPSFGFTTSAVSDESAAWNQLRTRTRSCCSMRAARWRRSGTASTTMADAEDQAS
jgi:TRAP-type C4-dicarboxylate transport system substrate-binding protein